MKDSYRNKAFRDLRDELITAMPPEQRLERTRRAESLLANLDPARQYPYEYFHSRIAAERPIRREHPDVTVEDAHHDIARLVEDVTSTINVRAEMVDERVLTADDVSKMLNVSTKTVNRWRRRGLVGRRFLLGGRRRIGFLQSSVDQFIRRARRDGGRGTQPRPLPGTAGPHFDTLARRSGSNPSLAHAALRRQRTGNPGAYAAPDDDLSRDFARRDAAHEIDRKSAEETEATRAAIYRKYRAGASVRSLARQFRRSEQAIDRAIQEMRLRRILELPLDYIPSAEFDSPDAEQVILGPTPQPTRAPRKTRRPANLPAYLASLYEVPLLTADQEVHLFRKYNYLKFRASRLRAALEPGRPAASIIDRIEQLYEEAVEVKNQIIGANLRLVVSIARKRVSDIDQLFELISDGNDSLMRAVEKFDYSRGFKFSTYASWAIKKNYARSYSTEMKYRDRFRTSAGELFDEEPEYRPDPQQQLRAQKKREAAVRKILRQLPERERQIIVRRFGLAADAKPKTLKQLAVEFGISKERVRQLETRAMKTLREAALIENVEVPEPS